jgi:hypothetical protein
MLNNLAFSKTISSAAMAHIVLHLVSMESQVPTKANNTKFKYLSAMGAEEIIFERPPFFT